MRNADLVSCQICGKYFVQVSHFHITREHGITMAEYQRLYPAAKTFGKKYSELRSRAVKKVRHNAKSYGSEFATKISATMRLKAAKGEIVSWNKGKTKETDQRLASHSAKIKALHANPESIYNDSEYRHKLSESRKGHPDYTTKDGIAKMQSAQLRNWVDPSSTFNDVEFRQRRGRAIAKAYERPDVQVNLQNARHARPNEFERDFADAYPILKYVGDFSFWVGSKNPDFIIPDTNVCIDLFGDYWHTKEEAEERVQYFKQHGHGLFILWESDWNEVNKND